MEEERLYPPRFTVNINGINAKKPETLVFTFKGSIETFVTEVMLVLPQQVSSYMYRLQLNLGYNHVTFCIFSL